MRAAVALAILERVVLNAAQIAPEQVRPLKRAEYERLVSLGCFAEERVELLYGLIVAMTPQDPAHAHPVQALNKLLLPRLLGRAEVRVQAPFAASDDSEPEPDIAVVPPGSYREEHPSRAYLIVEVAHTSLPKDRGVKAKLYAESNVNEYWVVDVVAKRVEVHRDPRDGAYTSVVAKAPGDTLSIAQFVDVDVEVAELF